MNKLALAVSGVLVTLSLTACLPKAVHMERCNNLNEIRVEGKEVFKCTEMLSEVENGRHVLRWWKLEEK